MKYIGNCHNGMAHIDHPARSRGNKTRYQCSRCLRMTGWTKDPVKASQAVSEVVADLVQRADVSPTFWNGATVADLREMAKMRGLTGYSKMKRDDLIAALS